MHNGYLPAKAWSSVFVGGGTPSMFINEYSPIMNLIRNHVTADCEITLESNVDDISAASLDGWRALGFNRLSLGVQSLHEKHLTFLTRKHSAAKAIDTVRLALRSFDTLNVDMIYGMPGHTPDEWHGELMTLIDLGVGHLSLYNLTYEKRTPLCKFMEKGRFIPMPEDAEAELYLRACELLAANGYHHDEVSNWALPTKSCRHNWLYWLDHPYLGIGAAAHSYLPGDSPFGVRFSYPQSATAFIAAMPPDGLSDLSAMIEASGGAIDERDLAAWVLETVGCSLRTSRGVDTRLICSKTHGGFKPNPLVSQGLADGRLYWRDKYLTLHVDQWFCESTWSLAVASSFPLT